MLDLLIKGGTLVDGTGAPARLADVGIQGDEIVEIGAIDAPARRVIDARGLLVTPGWVDIHTHYDGQVTWDSQLAPSFWHGVTTIVMGNCGVGFAPVRQDKRDWLIGVMEGVEDIPGAALSEGIEWEWESFPEYLDALDRRPYALNIAAQIPHAALRAYVMGERGADNSEASAEEIARMAAAVREGMEAGAFGFSTTRSIMHRAIDGARVPGATAGLPELEAIARAIGDSGRGIFEVAPNGLSGDDLLAPRQEIAWMKDISERIGIPVTFLCLQVSSAPDLWRELLAECRAARETGADVTPQVYSRAVGAILTLENKINPFFDSPTMRSLDDLPFEERVRRLKADPALRAAIAAEGAQGQTRKGDQYKKLFGDAWKDMYPVTTPIDYEPDPANSISAIARREGRDPRAVALDALLEDGGRGAILHQMAGYNYGDLEAQREMLSDPDTVLGGGDGGAHVAVICDAGVPTFMLTHWARDRARGPKLPLETVVRKQTSDTARTYGLTGRGQISVGYKADINLIDFDKLDFLQPHLTNDLPTGAPRLMQKSTGYVATIVNGVVIQENGEDSGARPGGLLRSVATRRPVPAAV
ncbi:amidohydrolase family protein [Rhizorhabdus wittichii]|uniref:Amidohydrolase family protein n=1 Tax=Rhizorhabdus wittichii TaxID=160791 RepID=A0A975D290_9SPHN|nr:amidohydrolase family protein [Rhizorhabdus wittichii]QTH21471.1 amidohydrolase family protein [Rhizorhabdus wittichii]